MIPDSPAPPGRRALRVLVGLVGAHVAGAGLLAAQFAVSPVIVQLAHDPTGTATLLRIDNESEDTMQFRVYAADFDQDRDGEHQFAAAGTLARSCAERLRFAPDALSVPAGSGAVVRVSLEPGADPTCWSKLGAVRPGGYVVRANPSTLPRRATAPGLASTTLVAGQTNTLVLAVPARPVVLLRGEETVNDAGGGRK